jgi:hypothetical protein
VSLRAGEERSGIDMSLRPAATVPVSGTLLGPGGPQPNTAVYLIPAYAANLPIESLYVAAMAVTNASGEFIFPAVAAGAYVAKAWRIQQVLVIGRDPLPADTSLWAETRVDVGGSATTGLLLDMRQGATLTGRVEFEGAGSPPPMPRLQPTVSAAFQPASWPIAFGNWLGTRVAPDGTFITQGLPPGSYFPRLPNQFSIHGWYFESVTRDGRDLTIEPLTLASTAVNDVIIRFSDRGAGLSGMIRDARGDPDANARVVVFPANYLTWIDNGTNPSAARVVASSQTGSYAVDLPPGDYRVAAATDNQLARWPEASIVRTLAAAASRITLARGESKRQDLRMP